MIEMYSDLILLFRHTPTKDTDAGQSVCFFSSPRERHMFKFFARTNSVEYVDAQGFLHESFWLVPTGYLFLLAGAVVFACVGARTIRAAIAKKKDE